MIILAIIFDIAKLISLLLTVAFGIGAVIGVIVDVVAHSVIIPWQLAKVVPPSIKKKAVDMNPFMNFLKGWWKGALVRLIPVIGPLNFYTPKIYKLVKKG